MRRSTLASVVAASLAATALTAFVQPGTEPSAPMARSAPEIDPTRVFPDPLIAGDFIQYTPNPVTGESQYLDGIRTLEERYPDVIEVQDICELACDDLSGEDLQTLERDGFLVRDDASGQPARITSVGGREIPVITVTDETYSDVPVDERIDLYVSMSIHGNERAGLEGSLRTIEDLAINWSAEQDGAEHLLSNGDPERPFYTEITTTEALRAMRLVFVDLNPDGWADGDRWGGRGLYKRGNDAGIDLNRQWPTLGWHNDSGPQYHTQTQPEAIAGKALIEGELGTPEGGADLHGELHDNVLLAIMFPAGQFDPGQLAGQVELAEAIKYEVNHSVHPGAQGLLVDAFEGPVYPAEYHTAYDAIGYDDSGFQGDYLVQQGILEMDHEYILSNLAPSSVFIPELEQVHVDTTRALLEATIVTTYVAYAGEGISYTAELGEKRVGYVHNPEVLTEDGAAAGPPFKGLAQKPYESTAMTYYEDLAPYLDAGSELEAISAERIAAGDTASFDVLVVTDRLQPTVRTRDGDIVNVDRDAFWVSLRAFAEAGGTLVLTDAALQGLGEMGVVSPGDVAQVTQYAGEIQDVDRSHPLLSGVGGIIGQTYFEVPLGFPVGGYAPAWTVAPEAWEAADGSVAANAQGAVALGSVPLGAGKITVFGAVLPTPSQEHPHTQGLADYAVTYAGNAILVNALAGL